MNLEDVEHSIRRLLIASHEHTHIAVYLIHNIRKTSLKSLSGGIGERQGIIDIPFYKQDGEARVHMRNVSVNQRSRGGYISWRNARCDKHPGRPQATVYTV